MRERVKRSPGPNRVEDETSRPVFPKRVSCAGNGRQCGGRLPFGERFEGGDDTRRTAAMSVQRSDTNRQRVYTQRGKNRSFESEELRKISSFFFHWVREQVARVKHATLSSSSLDWSAILLTIKLFLSMETQGRLRMDRRSRVKIYVVGVFAAGLIETISWPVRACIVVPDHPVKRRDFESPSLQTK